MQMPEISYNVGVLKDKNVRVLWLQLANGGKTYQQVDPSDRSIGQQSSNLHELC